MIEPITKPTNEVYAVVDAIQERFEKEFAQAYRNVNRERSKAFYDAGFVAGWRACFEHMRTAADDNMKR